MWKMTPNKTILYIEDAFENRMLIRRILEADGYTVLEAENARHALEVLNTGTPDLILMDINMPDIDGYTLTTQLRRLPSLENIPIIALTANVMRGDRERTIEAGCNGYIQKPIDVDTFSDHINRYLMR
jgi:two-component system cell cycle response regulator DivK